MKHTSVLDQMRQDFINRGWEALDLSNFVMSNDSGGHDTNDGFMVGTDPAQPRKASEWNGQQNASQQVSQPVVLSDDRQQPPPNGRYYTDDDISKARQQEKDKLYGRVEEMDKELKELRKIRKEQEDIRKAEEARISAEQKAKEEEQLELRDLIKQKDTEWSQRLSMIEQDRERDRATFEREKALMELEQYRISRVSQEEEYILPELRDLIRGNTITEVDASIEDMKNRTNAVMGNISGVTSQQPQQTYRGASPTAPPVGPMEQQTTYEQLTPDDIRSMDIETYKRYRESLLASASQQYRRR